MTGDVAGTDAETFLEDSGCQWLAKPFRLAEFLARVRALLRRGATPAQVVQGVRIDNDARRAWLGDREHRWVWFGSMALLLVVWGWNEEGQLTWRLRALAAQDS